MLQTIEKMPERIMIYIFTYLPHKELLNCAYVCQGWNAVIQKPELWRSLCLRPQYGGLQVSQLNRRFNMELT